MAKLTFSGILITVLILIAVLGDSNVDAQASEDSDSSFIWIAAGDSYSSGEGVSDDRQPCQLSLHTYSHQVARRLGDAATGEQTIAPNGRSEYFVTTGGRYDSRAEAIANEPLPSGVNPLDLNVWRVPVVNGRDEPDREYVYAPHGTSNPIEDAEGEISSSGGHDIDFRHVACSGGRTEDLFNDRTLDDNLVLEPQLDRFERGQADLITFTSGGNDVGFADILINCNTNALGISNLYSVDFRSPTARTFGPNCDLTTAEANNRISNLIDPSSDCRTSRHTKGDDTKYDCSLPVELPDVWGSPTFGLVDAYVHAAQYLKLDGTMLIIGYPRFYPENFAASVDDPIDVLLGDPLSRCGELNGTDIRLLNESAEAFDQALEDAVRLADSVTPIDIRFVSVQEAFAGYELCGSEDEGLNSIDLTEFSDSFHPTLVGHTVIADHLEPIIKEILDDWSIRKREELPEARSPAADGDSSDSDTEDFALDGFTDGSGLDSTPGCLSSATNVRLGSIAGVEDWVNGRSEPGGTPEAQLSRWQNVAVDLDSVTFGDNGRRWYRIGDVESEQCLWVAGSFVVTDDGDGEVFLHRPNAAVLVDRALRGLDAEFAVSTKTSANAEVPSEPIDPAARSASLDAISALGQLGSSTPDLTVEPDKQFPAREGRIVEDDSGCFFADQTHCQVLIFNARSLIATVRLQSGGNGWDQIEVTETAPSNEVQANSVIFDLDLSAFDTEFIHPVAIDRSTDRLLIEYKHDEYEDQAFAEVIQFSSEAAARQHSEGRLSWGNQVSANFLLGSNGSAASFCGVPDVVVYEFQFPWMCGSVSGNIYVEVIAWPSTNANLGIVEDISERVIFLAAPN